MPIRVLEINKELVNQDAIMYLANIRTQSAIIYSVWYSDWDNDKPALLKGFNAIPVDTILIDVPMRSEDSTKSDAG
jgi:hypothetical protein